MTDSVKKAEEAPRGKAITEMGVSGLRHQGGLIMEEELRQLKGKRRLQMFDEMQQNDDMVGGVLWAIEMLVRQVPWDVEPASLEPGHEEDAEWVHGALHDMSTSWEDTLAELLSMLWAGFAAHELVYKRRNGEKRKPGLSSRFSDGKLGWRKWALRGQLTVDHWLFDDEGGVSGLVQMDPDKYTLLPIPIEKLLIFRPSTYKGNPEGHSLLRRAYVSYYYKKRLRDIEAIGAERDLVGIPVAWVPQEWMESGADDDQKASLAATKEMVVNIRRDEQEGIVMPMAFDENGNLLMKLELLQGAGTRQFDLDKIMVRADRAIAASMLADFMMLGHEGSGSFALSKDKTELFLVALGTILDSVAAVVNRHAIPRIFRLNGWPTAELPKLTHGKIQKANLEWLGEYLNKLAGAGMPVFPNEDLEAHVLRVADLPAREPGEEEL